jgi:predicted CXXCH cytochrome family protein
MHKKLLFALLVVGLLLILSATVVSANGGPHGDYTPTTDACAGCHRAHTAQGANLLINSGTNGLCLTCHGAGATGALTNVSYGVLEATAGSDTGTALVGGGFDFVGGSAVTSSHADATNLAWGYGTAARGTSADMGDTLDCGSCHDPHGNGNYRILVSNVTTDYDPAGNYSTESWDDLLLTDFCVSCHTTYMESVNTNHEVNVDLGYLSVTPTLPLADDAAADDTLICSTCHYSHGTAAAATGLADDGPSADSALLRMDNRGVCQDCHDK